VEGRGSTLVSLVSELAIAANARPDCPLSRGTHDLWDCLQQNNEGVPPPTPYAAMERRALERQHGMLQAGVLTRWTAL
jgi:hypothetical protein